MYDGHIYPRLLTEEEEYDGHIYPPTLTQEEEKALLEKIGTKEEKTARNELIEHNLWMVGYLAKKLDVTGVYEADLFSVGTRGLIKASNTFDPEKNIKFTTYASRCIENEILMYLRKQICM